MIRLLEHLFVIVQRMESSLGLRLSDEDSVDGRDEKLEQMRRKKSLREMFAVTLILSSSVGCGTRATPPAVLAPIPEPISMVSMSSFRDPYLGFVVEYPLGWEVTEYREFQVPTGRTWTAVGFMSNLYMGGEQAFGRYGIEVAVGEALGTTLTDTVESRLNPIIAEVRDDIRLHCCLTVGREQAMELTGFPWGRWGCRQVVVLHDGRAYWLTFYPRNEQFHTSADKAAQYAFEAFLRSFAFIPVTVLPTPTITPVPTPISGLSWAANPVMSSW